MFAVSVVGAPAVVKGLVDVTVIVVETRFDVVGATVTIVVRATVVVRTKVVVADTVVDRATVVIRAVGLVVVVGATAVVVVRETVLVGVTAVVRAKVVEVGRTVVEVEGDIAGAEVVVNRTTVVVCVRGFVVVEVDCAFACCK